MKSHSDTKCLTTRLPADLAEQAKLFAKAKDQSFNQFLVDAVKAAVMAEMIELAKEGYAAMAEECVREVKEWMPAISKVVESDGGY